jgi:hypothetical protein
MEKKYIQNKLVILDCCHAQINFRDWKFDFSDSYRILTASGRLESAQEMDEFKASFMTYHIHQTLLKCSNEVVNKDTNEVNISEIYHWVKCKTQEYNNRQYIREQIPEPNLLANEKYNFPIAKKKQVAIGTHIHPVDSVNIETVAKYLEDAYPEIRFTLVSNFLKDECASCNGIIFVWVEPIKEALRINETFKQFAKKINAPIFILVHNNSNNPGIDLSLFKNTDQKYIHNNIFDVCHFDLCDSKIRELTVPENKDTKIRELTVSKNKDTKLQTFIKMLQTGK